MPMGLWVVIGFMAFVAASAFAMIAWGLRTGQFDDMEAVKYRMLEDVEPQDWPGRHEPKGGAHGA